MSKKGDDPLISKQAFLLVIAGHVVDIVELRHNSQDVVEKERTVERWRAIDGDFRKAAGRQLTLDDVSSVFCSDDAHYAAHAWRHVEASRSA